MKMTKRLPKSLPGQYTAHLPLPPEMNASGLWDQRSSRFWRRQSQNLKSAVRNYQNLGRSFLKSYEALSIKKVAHLRDFALAQAISHSLVNTQYQSLNRKELTSVAKSYWSTHSFFSLWSKNKDYSQYTYLGTLGSVAFSLLDRSPLGSDIDVIDILEEQQSLFWKRLDLHRVPLERKYSEFLRRMRVRTETIQRTESVLLSLFDKGFSEENYDLTRQLFSLGIMRGEVRNLFYRIQKLEISPELVEIISTLSDRGLVSAHRNWIREELAKFIRVSPPGGINTFYQALATESYLRLAQYITQTFDLYSDLEEWERNLSSNELITIYGYFSLVYDALRLSDTINVLQPSISFLERLLWYYSDNTDQYNNSWGRLDLDIEIPKAKSTIRPPKGKGYPIIETRPYVRSDVEIFYRTLSNPNTFYLCSLDSDRDPLLLEVEKETKRVTLKLDQPRERLVLTPTPITSPEALETLETHSNLIEVKHVDIEPPYQP